MPEILVVLRMNREVMDFMQGEYAEETSKTEPLKMTAIAEEEQGKVREMGSGLPVGCSRLQPRLLRQS